MIMVRLVIGIVSSLLVVNSMSFYDQPFGGCEESGLITLVPGCTSWQYFGLGLAIVFLFWVVKPKYLSLKYWGLLLVILLALLGGPPALSNGTLLDIWNSPSIIIYYWREYGLAILLGGFVGISLLVVLERWLALRQAKSFD